MENDFYIEDGELTKYIISLNSVNTRVASKVSKWVRHLTKYTHGRMRVFATSRSPRSKGRLKSSISSKYFLTGKDITGMVYVPSDITYQFAAEEGVKTRYIIRGTPTMTFPVSAWRKGRRSGGYAPNRGFYVFTQVRRGRYKGKHFTQRAFDSLNQYYHSQEDKILADLGEAILISRG